MNEQVIYLDNKSLLVSTGQKGLVRVRCPFKVECINENIMKVDEIKTVELLEESEEFKLLYKIDEVFYPFNWFIIVVL